MKNSLTGKFRSSAMKPDKKNETNYSEEELKEWEQWAEEWVEDLKEQDKKRAEADSE